ncbi:MAG TPA: multicopper oxidase domain-containing protein, partial [Deferrisomatales bacterium]|nr:multicopper oxidase domain-containing protein [Deferrisomatales bacterium]
TDAAVEAGRFDQAGMGGMGEMGDMGGMHEGMGAIHGAGHGGMGGESMQSMSHPSNHGEGHPAQEPHSGAGEPPSGRRFATAFRPLAADVSSAADLAMDGMDPRRPWSPYDKLRATRPTSLPAGQPVRELRFTLDGDMERYVWLLNNKALAESDVIHIREGEAVRFILINRTMMHHPMHLHGHFFRVVTEQGDRSPLKHTVDVAPMSTTVIEFDANEVGDWFFHCHLLYHMKSGMARVVHYDGFDAGPEVAAGRPALYRDPWYAWGQADVLTSMTEGTLQASNTRNVLAAGWEVGWQHLDGAEWEGIATWDRVLNRFTSLFAGGDFLGVDDDVEDVRAIAGVRYLLPLSIESRWWLDSELGARITLGRRLDLTPRLGLSGEVGYDTHAQWEGRVTADYTLTRGFSILGSWHSQFGWGAGVQVRF